MTGAPLTPFQAKVLDALQRSYPRRRVWSSLAREIYGPPSVGDVKAVMEACRVLLAAGLVTKDGLHYCAKSGPRVRSVLTILVT